MTHLPLPRTNRAFLAPERRATHAAAPRDARAAADLLRGLGFVSRCDLPDQPGPAYLLVALRPAPTLHHYDPEAVDYWVSVGGRGHRRRISRDSRLPIHSEYSWGLIRLVDRLHVTNEYLSFGGDLSAEVIDDVVVARFVSSAPILRRGGHSQGWDEGAEALGAFFGRFMLAIDYVPGFEATAAAASPLTRYAAFLSDAVRRYRASSPLRAAQHELSALLHAAARRLSAEDAMAWAAGTQLANAAASVTRDATA